MPSDQPSFDQIDTYSMVNAALSGIMIKPLFIIWCISMCLARRRSDPARTAVSWMKAVYPFEIINLILLVVGDAITVVVNVGLNYGGDSGDGGDFYQSTLFTINQIGLRLSFIAALLERIADVLMVITLVELGNGFMFAQSHSKAAYRSVLLWLSVGLAVALGAIAIADCGQANSAYSTFWGSDTDFFQEDSAGPDQIDQLNSSLLVSNRLETAFDVLEFVISIALVVYASLVVHTYRAHPTARSSTIIYLVATILWMIRFIWFIAYDALWVIPADPNFSIDYLIVDPILNVWLFFVVLVLVFVIGVRKRRGLWSVQQGRLNNGTRPVVVVAQQPSYMYGMPPGQVAYEQRPAGYVPAQQPVQGWQQHPQYLQQHVPQQAYYALQAQSVSPVRSDAVASAPTEAPEGHVSGQSPSEMKA